MVAALAMGHRLWGTRRRLQSVWLTSCEHGLSCPKHGGLPRPRIELVPPIVLIFNHLTTREAQLLS